MRQLVALMFVLLVPISVGARSRSLRAEGCGVRFQYSSNWIVKVSKGNGFLCRITVSPKNLRELMPTNQDGLRDDPYTVVVLPGPDNGDDERNDWAGMGVGGGGEWKRIEMNGLRGWANEERYGRKYFENGGGYCCLSSEPVTILSDGKTSTTVVGSAKGDEVYRLIVRTLRIVTSSPNSRLQRTAGRHLRHFFRALRAARSR
jgi:hypothetical protein